MHQSPAGPIRLFVAAVLVLLTLSAVGDPVPLAPVPASTPPALARRLAGYQASARWPQRADLGVPLYPDLRAFMVQRFAAAPAKLATVLFTTHAPAARVLKWYARRLPEWHLDKASGVLAPRDCGTPGALHNRCPYIEAQNVKTHQCGPAFDCTGQVAISYRPGP